MRVSQCGSYSEPQYWLSIQTLLFQQIRIDFTDHALEDIHAFLKTLFSNAKIENIHDLSAFQYFKEKQRALLKSDELFPNGILQGWCLYYLSEEYKRQGVLRHPLNTETGSSNWRISFMNEDYEEISTYPSRMVIPKKLSDSVLHYAAKYRSKGRIPALVFYYTKNGTTLLRSSQPLAGLSMKRCYQDEKLVTMLLHPDDSNETKEAYIIDARSTTAAYANLAAGAGIENMENYPGCQRLFLGIDNIHGMRESLLRLLEALSGLNAEVQLETIYEMQQWYKHITCLVDSSIMITKMMSNESKSVLVHCSDGWDRTTQLVSLASVLLDPYYRTISGLLVLIEKEWTSFGHRFQDRAGLLSSAFVPSSNTSYTLFSYSKREMGKEFSPMFPQFLEALYQFIKKWPAAFQYNEVLLRFLYHAYYSGQYGNFIFNCEKEAVQIVESSVIPSEPHSMSCPSLTAFKSIPIPGAKNIDCDDFVIIASPPSTSAILTHEQQDPNHGKRICDFTVHIYEDILPNWQYFYNSTFQPVRECLPLDVPVQMSIWSELYTKSYYPILP